MIFHSLTYLVFLAIVLALYWSLPRRGQNFMLIIASYVFYGWEHPWFLLPLWASTLVDYGCALGMEVFPSKKRLFLVTSIAASIALLATFKYYGFVVENLNAILTDFGSEPIRNTFRLVLPAGLSFYTFQSIGYVVDVYRGNVKPVRNLADYALYVTFFPQLVAGPIERAGHMLPQYLKPRHVDAEDWRTALGLILWGYFKKVVVADNTAVIANKIFALQDASFPIIWAGVLAFTVQIYADFSGYTDIARGTARLLGIDLMINFNHPYLATSPADFWRRWHISLSTWMRDFIYIPLGGGRCSLARICFNLMVTFAISGLWHGASWNFVLWGIYWGLLIVIQRIFASLGWTLNLPGWSKVVLTFAATCFGWLLFREHSLGQIAHDLAQSPFSATSEQWRMATYFCSLVLIYALPMVIHLAATGFPGWQIESRLSPRGRFALETFAAALLLLGIVTIRSIATSDFIYFQF
jgi:D-alanyl-lipoteichoic acid acyltransferase DltB (MBOAT superfamily)